MKGPTNIDLERRSDLSLEKILYLLQDGVIVLNRSGVITYINKAAQEIMEKQIMHQPQVGDYFLNLARPGREEITRIHIEDAFANKSTVFRLLYPQNGEDFWIELGYYPMPSDEEGVIEQICIRARNVTEQVVLENRLKEERKRARLALNRARLTAQDHERSEISQELHDNVNQVLTIVKLYNEIALQDKFTNTELLEKSVQQLNMCIEVIRSLTRRLSTPVAQELDLEEAIKDLATSISATKKVEVHVSFDGVKDESLDKALKVSIYRIVQEQLTNILKYAEAKKAEVNLIRSRTGITLKVLDDGKGFNVQKKRKGIGITNMVHRAEAFGGHLCIKSKIGAGTALVAEFPL
jgi:signal transduction histidine kinase